MIEATMIDAGTQDLPTLDAEERGYLVHGQLAFGRRFLRAMSFHEPEGLAAVADETGAYHIDTEGQPRYAQRFRETFGFYGGIATVRDEAGYHHINARGLALHTRRFSWSGNFQEGLCPVQDGSGFYHIHSDGTAAYRERYSYAGDFRYGVAAVRATEGVIHILGNGARLHPHAFQDAGPFHKGMAVVSDRLGFHHIDKAGRPIHPHRFRSAEPFYNGVALCTTHDGRSVRLRETGYFDHLPSTAPRTTVTTLLSHLDEGISVGLFLRHAKRFPLTSDWGDQVPLTEEGIAQARRLGERFHGRGPARIYASPVHRCVQTGRSFADGAGAPNVEVTTTTLLGAPGPFADPERGHEVPRDPRDYHGFATSYLELGRAPGMRPLESACEALHGELRTKMESGLTIFVTHDLFVAGLLQFLGLKRPTRDDWAEYLEGVSITIRPDGRIEAHRFLGLEEISTC